MYRIEAIDCTRMFLYIMRTRKGILKSDHPPKMTVTKICPILCNVNIICQTASRTKYSIYYMKTPHKNRSKQSNDGLADSNNIFKMCEQKEGLSLWSVQSFESILSSAKRFVQRG